MNVFVLSTGRCGSTTFVEACRHITNYTAAHESRARMIGDAHFAYPERHIEADNRLSWFLGSLDAHFGDRALYVHQTRDAAGVAASYERRYFHGIMRAYGTAMIGDAPDRGSRYEVALDYVRTVNANIEHFLKDKTRVLSFELEHAQRDFRRFWEAISPSGSLSAR